MRLYCTVYGCQNLLHFYITFFVAFLTVFYTDLFTFWFLDILCMKIYIQAVFIWSIYVVFKKLMDGMGNNWESVHIWLSWNF